jgi:hypothetical protein
VVLVVLAGATIAQGLWAWTKRKGLLHRELTNLFRVPVSFQEADVSLQGFMHEAQVTLRGLELGSSNPRAAQSPWVVDSAHLQLSLRQFGEPSTPRTLDSVALHGVQLQMYLDDHYTGNFRLFAHYDATRPAPDSVLLPHFTVQGLRYHYHQLPDDRDYVLILDTLNMALAIRRRDVEVRARGMGRSGYWREGDFSLLEDKPLGIAVHTLVSKADQRMFIQQAELTLSRARFNLAGEWPLGRHLYYDLAFSSPEGDIEVLLSLMPERSARDIRALQPTGLYAFQGSMRGLSSGTSNPHLEIHFQGRDVAVASGINGLDLSHLAVKGTYSNGSTNSVATTYIDIQEAQGLLNNRPIVARLRIDQLQDPLIVAQTQLRVAANEVAHLARVDSLGQLWGYANIHLKVQGAVRDMATLRTLNRLTYSGNVELDSLGATPSGWPLTLDGLRGTVRFDNDSLGLHQVHGTVNGEPFTLQALAPSFFPYMFGQTPKLATQVHVGLDSTRLEALALSLAALGKESQQRKAAKLGLPANAPRPHWLDVRLPQNLDAAVTVSGAHVSAAGTVYDSLSAVATLRNQVLNVPRYILWNTATELKGWAHVDASSPNRTAAQGQTSFNTQTLQAALPGGRTVPPDSQLAAGLDVGWRFSAQRNVPPGTVPPARLVAEFSGGYVTDSARGLYLQGLHLPMVLTEAQLTNPRQAPWLIDSLTATLNGHPILLRAHTTGLQPTHEFEAQLQTRLPLPVVQRLAPLSGLDSLSGWLDLNSLFRGQIAQLTPDSLRLLQAAGQLHLEGVGGRLRSRNLPIRGMYAGIRFNDDGARIDHLSGYLGRSDIRLAGTLGNILPFLYQPAAGLEANLLVSSDTLLLNELLLGASSPDSAQTARLGLPDNSNIELRFRAGHLSWNSFRADTVLLDAAVNDRIVTLRRANFAFAGGRIDAFGGLNATDTSRIRLRLDVDAQHLDFQQAFRTFNNFNQRLLTADNARGRLYFHLTYLDTQHTGAGLPQHSSPTGAGNPRRVAVPVRAAAATVVLLPRRIAGYRALRAGSPRPPVAE